MILALSAGPVAVMPPPIVTVFPFEYPLTLGTVTVMVVPLTVAALINCDADVAVMVPAIVTESVLL